MENVYLKMLEAVGLDADEDARNQQRFYIAYAQAVERWSFVERELARHFCQITGMSATMAYKVFYSARNFSGRCDMVVAALAGSHTFAEATTYFKAALLKARHYYGYRNSIVHGEPTADWNADSPTFGQKIVLPGDADYADAWGDARKAISMADLEYASERFGALAGNLMSAREAIETLDRPSLQTLTEQVRALPTLPRAREAIQKKAGPSHQPKSPRRKRPRREA